MIGEIDKKTELVYEDALLYLARKNVSIFFYHRVGELEGFEYAKTAINRMNEKKSFVKMYEAIDENENDLQELIGKKYSKRYIEELGKIPQIIKINNRYIHEDTNKELIHVINGNRLTMNTPKRPSRRIHIYGRCGVFGYAVEDSETMPSYLQKELLMNGFNEFEVINHGLWGGEDKLIDHNFFFDVKTFEEGDVVIFYRHHFNDEVMSIFEKYGMWYKDITFEWHGFKEAKWCFYDKPGHMNYVGYRNVAHVIFEDLVSKGFKQKKIKLNKIHDKKESYLDEYILNNKNLEFEKEIDDYVDMILKKNNKAIGKNNGAIVMNANPFTLGHRSLVEYASNSVDYLYIFVVEEDKSYFRFVDRFQMVKEGVADIENVIVVPSGKFIISAYTFPEYFMKDYVKEKDIDLTNDVSIFANYIAPKLSIKKRFVGEEPFDEVTKKYNETMSEILPRYNIMFEVIERKKNDDNIVITATKVRNLIKEKNYSDIKKYLPETTIKFILSKYVNEK